MMINRALSWLSLLILLAALTGPVQARPAAPTEPHLALVLVTIPTADALAQFQATGLPAYAQLVHGDVLTGADPAGQESLAQAGLSFRVLDPAMIGATYYLAYPLPTQAPPDWASYGRVLLDHGLEVLLRIDSPESTARLAQAGVELHRLTFEAKPLRPWPISTGPAAIQPDPIIQSMLDQVLSSTVYQYDGDLSGEWPVLVGGEPYTITTRHTYSGEPIQKATQFVGEHMAALGLDVEYHVWDTITNPNVIGEIRGIVDPEDIFILSAHLDDMPSGPLAPGADDNASGVVAALVAADVLSQYNWACTLRFVVFTGEEQGLLGSKAYAHRSRLIRENILNVLNLDMVSFNTIGSSPDIDLHAKGGFTPTLELAQLYSDVVSVYNLDLIPQIWPSGSGGSDHSAFWIHGYSAILGIEDYGDFNPYYHTTEDTLDKLDLDYFTEFVKASLGTLAHMSDCLITGGLGFADGYVSAAGSGSPIEGATVTFENDLGQSMPATSAASGYYTRTLPVDVYTATAWAYGYLPATVTGLTILTDAVTTQDFSLPTAPLYVVSGTVSEAGTGTPLHARITVPGMPVAPVWSDPATGFYSLTIAAGTFTFHITATEHHAADQVVVVDGNRTQDFSLEPYACILLVDDDQNSPNSESYYTSALDAMGVTYDMWNTDDGEPTPHDLIGHRMVLWFTTKLDSDTFVQANEDAVATYLDGGGRFFLTSQDYLSEAGLTPFGQNYLGIASFTPNQNRYVVAGNDGNPVGGGLGPFTLVVPPGWYLQYGQWRPDNVDGIQASPFRWQVTGQNNSTNYSDGNFKTVFLGWPIEGLEDVNDRITVLGSVINWFGGCQDSWLTGQVTDAISGAPLSGTVVTTWPWQFADTTGANGHYSITLPAGSYDVTAVKAGYVTQTITGVLVQPGLTTTQDFALMPTCDPVTEAEFYWTPLTPTAGQVVTLTGSASGTAPIAYSWDLGDGTMGTGITLTHSYTAAGRYRVVLTATNCAMAAATAVHTVTVVPACEPISQVDFDWVPLTPTVGQVITFTASATGTTPFAFTWDFGDGTGGFGPMSTHVYTSSGDYTVTLTATNNCGQATVSTTITLAQIWEVYLPVVLK